MHDEQIVELYWQRNENAIAETAEKYEKYLSKVAYNILGNSEDSRECVNDTYLKAWNSIPPHKPERLLAYLSKITRAAAIDVFRKKNSAKRGASDALRMNNTMKGKSTKYGKIKGWAAAAACLCFVIIGAAALSPFGLRDGDSKNENDGISSKMIGFFIYEGRCYVQYREIYEDVDLIDKHLGTVTGLIDEWTPEDGYVDFAGSAQGDFYSVKGYDPSFMLCMREPDGAINLFICNNGITLKYGSELFEDRLHLAGNYSKVLFESYDSWNYGKEELFRLEGKDETVSRFVECLDVAEFIPENSVSFYDEIKELYHLYFVKNDGVTVELRLCEKGYVRFQGILDVCLRLPEEEYDSFLKLLDSGIGNNADSIRNSAGITLTDCMNDSMLGKYVPEYTVLLSHGLRNTAETAGQVQ